MMSDNNMGETHLRDMLTKALALADSLGHTLTAIRIAEAIDETRVSAGRPAND
jgi:hypothetical protein